MTINLSTDALMAWFRAKNITSHTVAVVAGTAATIISTDQQARNFLITLCGQHSIIATDIFGLAAIILTYKHSSSPAGTVATASEILAAPNPPTVAEVAAADPANPTQGTPKNGA